MGKAEAWCSTPSTKLAFAFSGTPFSQEVIVIVIIIVNIIVLDCSHVFQIRTTQDNKQE
jgi:hypothetical protein